MSSAKSFNSLVGTGQVWAYGLSGIQLLEQCFDPIDRDPDARHWWVWAGAHTGNVVTIFINENT